MTLVKNMSSSTSSDEEEDSYIHTGSPNCRVVGYYDRSKSFMRWSEETNDWEVVHPGPTMKRIYPGNEVMPTVIVKMEAPTEAPTTPKHCSTPPVQATAPAAVTPASAPRLPIDPPESNTATSHPSLVWDDTKNAWVVVGCEDNTVSWHPGRLMPFEKEIEGIAPNKDPMKRPRGRNPVGKVWDFAKGEWVEGVSIPRPPGRKRRGYDWDDLHGEWIVDPTIVPGRPRGRPKKNHRWDTIKGIWVPLPAEPRPVVHMPRGPARTDPIWSIDKVEQPSFVPKGCRWDGKRFVKENLRMPRPASPENK